MPLVPRVAFLADTFHEVNGAARTCRELAAFAWRRGYPFFSVRFGNREHLENQDPFWTLELKRSPISIGVDADLGFDLLFYRRRQELEDRLRLFAPDVIHIMAPAELGILGAIAAHRMKVPMVASWHTNLHEYAARRGLVGALDIGEAVEGFVLNQILRLYRRAAVLLAPSPELVELLHSRTGKPALLMSRGIDAVAFSPNRRRRSDTACVIGHIGRLTPEKGVRFLRILEDRLTTNTGERDFRLYVAGVGSEAAWLRANLKKAEFEGVLNPEDLGKAYANMDVFVFPSRTDTFGNVVQEALASGVPVVVTNSGGPKTIVEHGVTGLVASSDEEMCDHVLHLLRNPEERKAMGAAGRERMLTRSWDQVFEDVYRAYVSCLEDQQPAPAQRGKAPM